MQLNDIAARLDRAFGDELPISEGLLVAGDLQRLLADDSYQLYLQDQVSRQVIRDYLTNAVVLGHLPEAHLDRFSGQIATQEGRNALSLYMLMHAVEDAGCLVEHEEAGSLQPLGSAYAPTPNLTLVPK